MALRLATFGHILDPIFHLAKKNFIHIESKLQHFSLIIILPSSLWPPDSDLALICSVGKTKIQFHARIFDLVLGLFPLIICLFIYLFIWLSSHVAAIFSQFNQMTSGHVRRWLHLFKLHSCNVLSNISPQRQMFNDWHWLISWPLTSWLQSGPKTGGPRLEPAVPGKETTYWSTINF